MRIATELRWPKKGIPLLKTLFQVLAPNERKRKKQERETETEKESVTCISSRSLQGRGDLRRTLGHHSNTLRGARVCLSYRMGF
jgi:hypothetical protein